MFRLADVIQPKPGETVHAVARRHGVTLWPKLFLAGALIVLPFFFLFTLTRWGAPGMTLLAVSVAAGLLLALRTFHLWDADVLVITSNRLVDVDQRGLWSRVVSEAPLSAVQEVRCERNGLGETICRMGTLIIRTAAATPEIVVPKLPRPERLASLINDLRDQGGESEQMLRVRTLLAEADPGTLSAIESVLREKR